MVKLSKIKPNPDNPRLIKDERFKKLVQSIKDFPKMMELRPIITDEKGMILGGNMRLKAIQELGMKEIPDSWVKKASDLSEEQKREFIIKDNIGFGDWEWETLANNWDEGQLEEWGLEIPGFAFKEAVEDDYEIPDEIQTDIVTGDLFEIGQHRLLCGDSTNADDVAKVMDNCKPILMVTDPPYNALKSWNKSEAKSETRLDPAKWFANDNMEWDEYKKFINDFVSLFEGEVVYCWCDFRVYEIIKAIIEKNDYKTRHCIVWKKSSFGLGKHYRFQHEFCVYSSNNAKNWQGGATQSDVWEIEIKRDLKHSTPKPVECMARPIRNNTYERETCYDPFLGSGTTMVAAHQLNRKCIGIEISPQYCQIIIERMLKLDPSLEIKRNGKPYSLQDNNTEKTPIHAES